LERGRGNPARIKTKKRKKLINMRSFGSILFKAVVEIKKFLKIFKNAVSGFLKCSP